MKPIVWTKHAEDEVVFRNLDRRLVEETARAPDWAEPDKDDPDVERRFRRWPELGDRVLRVPVVETEAHIRIVTAVLDRNARRRRP